MYRQALYFTAARRIEVREEPLPLLKKGQVLVQALASAISPGTELLFYRGQVPEDMEMDTAIPSLRGRVQYPFQYGYASVGRVVETGKGVNPAWLERPVFTFRPHVSHHTCSLDELIPLPPGMPPERALFLPNMETALNFVQDSRPLMGEFCAVFGLGIVGLLTAGLLGSFPLAGLAAFEKLPMRREAGKALGLETVLDPDDREGWLAARETFRERGMPDGLDLALELSGSPAALDQAIRLTGYAGRILIGSWYGAKLATLDLGGAFHRSRIQLISSQVSTIAPELSGRWTKARRFGLAWERLDALKPERWITQRFALEQAGEAYRLLDETPGAAIQVVFQYSA